MYHTVVFKWSSKFIIQLCSQGAISAPLSYLCSNGPVSTCTIQLCSKYELSLDRTTVKRLNRWTEL